MPRITRPPKRDLAQNHEELVQALMKELAGPTLGDIESPKLVPRPVIIEEEMANGDRLRVYVNWKHWEGVQENHRTAAILDAYLRALGAVHARRIVIALGLTPKEADELGIQE